MSLILDNVYRTRVPEGQVAVFGMGQAGFVFKQGDGLTVALDIYLSNCCQRYFGFKRLITPPFLPGEGNFDLILSTHAHFDHFDVDAMPFLLAEPGTELVCARDCLAECERLHLMDDRVHALGKGEALKVKGIAIEAVDCDHGELAPDALGLVITLSGKRIYIMGDTAYRPDLLEQQVLQKPDLLILPINGAFGNLNEEQAARVVKRLDPTLAIPCHYGMFAAHGGLPQRFMDAMTEIAPRSRYTLLPMGTSVLL